MESVPLSALRHHVYCPRRCALIHAEQLWQDNVYTAEGQLVHERVDGGALETRRGVRIERSVRVASERFGVHGVVDLVEWELERGVPLPVEYKRGLPAGDLSDVVQLCAQGICLEEMTGQVVNGGALWHGKMRRRQHVLFSEELRGVTLETIRTVRELLSSGITPAPVYGDRCRACSLIEVCQPKVLHKDRSQGYVAALFQEANDA